MPKSSCSRQVLLAPHVPWGAKKHLIIINTEFWDVFRGNLIQTITYAEQLFDPAFELQLLNQRLLWNSRIRALLELRVKVGGLIGVQPKSP